MKKLVLAALLAVSLSSVAQQRRERPNRDEMEKLTPEQRQEKHLKKMTTDLNLNAKQQEEVKKLLADQSAKAADFKAKRETKKEERLLANSKERKEMAAKMKAEKEATEAQMKKILSPEQYTKWENDRAIRQEKMMEKRGDRKMNKGGY
jgi:protein CpxP